MSSSSTSFSTDKAPILQDTTQDLSSVKTLPKPSAEQKDAINVLDIENNRVEKSTGLKAINDGLSFEETVVLEKQLEDLRAIEKKINKMQRKLKALKEGDDKTLLQTELEKTITEYKKKEELLSARIDEDEAKNKADLALKNMPSVISPTAPIHAVTVSSKPRHHKKHRPTERQLSTSTKLPTNNVDEVPTNNVFETNFDEMPTNPAAADTKKPDVKINSPIDVSGNSLTPIPSTGHSKENEATAEFSAIFSEISEGSGDTSQTTNAIVTNELPVRSNTQPRSSSTSSLTKSDEIPRSKSVGKFITVESLSSPPSPKVSSENNNNNFSSEIGDHQPLKPNTVPPLTILNDNKENPVKVPSVNSTDKTPKSNDSLGGAVRNTVSDDDDNEIETALSKSAYVGNQPSPRSGHESPLTPSQGAFANSRVITLQQKAELDRDVEIVRNKKANLYSRITKTLVGTTILGVLLAVASMLLIAGIVTPPFTPFVIMVLACTLLPVGGLLSLASIGGLFVMEKKISRAAGTYPEAGTFDGMRRPVALNSKNNIPMVDLANSHNVIGSTLSTSAKHLSAKFSMPIMPHVADDDGVSVSNDRHSTTFTNVAEGNSTTNVDDVHSTDFAKMSDKGQASTNSLASESRDNISIPSQKAEQPSVLKRVGNFFSNISFFGSEQVTKKHTTMATNDAAAKHNTLISSKS